MFCWFTNCSIIWDIVVVCVIIMASKVVVASLFMRWMGYRTAGMFWLFTNYSTIRDIVMGVIIIKASMGVVSSQSMGRMAMAYRTAGMS